MPFVRVGYLEGQYQSEGLQAISQSIMQALVECFHAPLDDYFQVFDAYNYGEFFYDKHYLTGDRSDKLLFIQVTCGPGRTREQKKHLYKRFTDLLSTNCNVSEADVFVVLHETGLENWSFGKGTSLLK